jgi:hypothetical protein
MSLKILCAGCSPEERSAVEAGVRVGLGDRPRRDPWTVSLVKFGTGWSVTLDGPTVRGRRTSFMVPGGAEKLADALRSAADPSSVALSPAAPERARTGAAGDPERRDSHTCSMCARPYVLVYEAEPDEPFEESPVACPHCWQICRVQVARSASLGRDYRADKL